MLNVNLPFFNCPPPPGGSNFHRPGGGRGPLGMVLFNETLSRRARAMLRGMTTNPGLTYRDCHGFRWEEPPPPTLGGSRQPPPSWCL